MKFYKVDYMIVIFVELFKDVLIDVVIVLGDELMGGNLNFLI